MPDDDTLGPIDRSAEGIIRRKARRLIGKAGLTEADYDDLVQEFILKVLESWPAFDLAKGPRHQFVKTLVERHAANLLRRRSAAMRHYRRTRSLHTRVRAEDGRAIELGQTLAHDVHDRRLRRQPRDGRERMDLAIDLAEAEAGLPDGQRDLAERLRAQPLAEVARRRGVPRSSLNEVRRRLRRRLEKAGLRDYL